MTDALQDTFANVTYQDDVDRRRRWRIDDPILDRLEPRQEAAIEALEIAERTAEDEGRLRHAKALADVRDRLLARLTAREALRSEADAEAVLTALGQVARPGPKVDLDPQILDAVIEALRGPFRLRIQYGEPHRRGRA